MYQPDNWVLLKLPEDVGYKVLGGWSGGYTDSDSWRVNSGILEVLETKHYYDLVGYTGSVYRVGKGTERVSMAMAGTLAQMTKMGCERVTIEEVQANT